MKQSEKLDLILRFLYEKKFDGNYYKLSTIFSHYKILMNFDEASALVSRLERDGLIEDDGTEEGIMDIRITTYGVDYIENDSYTYRGHSAITNNYNISVTDSTYTNVVQKSSNVSISLNNHTVDDLIQKILSKLESEKVEKQTIIEISECLDEIKMSLQKNLKPNFSYRSLLTMTSEFSSVAAFVLSLGQLIAQH